MIDGQKPTGCMQRSVTCPCCQNTLGIFHADTQTVGCTHCTAVLKVSDNEVEATAISQAFQPARSFIKCGQTATIDGKNYRVIGRGVWKSTYKEYWVEDGEQGYSDEKWDYEEWILTDDSGNLWYIFEDDEGYHFATPITPQHPNLPTYDTVKNGWLSKDQEKIEVKDFIQGRTETVLEVGHATLHFLEGEIPWETKVGAEIFFATYQHDGKRYTVETDKGEQDAAQGDYFEEEGTTKRYLMECFANDPTVTVSLQEGKKAQKNYNFWAIVMVVFTVLSLFMYLIWGDSSGRLVKSQTYTVPAAKDTSKTAVIEPLPIGRLALALQKGPVKIKLSSRLPTNTALWAGIEVRDAQDLTINTLDEQFFDDEGVEYWQEEGESGTEAYHEQTVAKEELFAVEQDGNYAIEVFVAPQSPKNTEVTVAVYERVMSGTYFVTLAIAGLLATAALILIGYFSMPWRK
jgi:hypothetical protein